jgi:small subunit ribosomal protein S9
MPKKKTTTKKPKATKKTAVSKAKDENKPKAAQEKDKTAKPADKKNEYLYAVGKRKTAIAQVRVYKKGSGKITVNEKDFKKVYPKDTFQEVILRPLELVGQNEKLDVTVKVYGGGVTGQTEAIRHGISRALIQLNPNFRKPLKKAGFLCRDDRMKERKKPGLKKARRAPQWSKR